jgi:hypothetical protein
MRSVLRVAASIALAAVGCLLGGARQSYADVITILNIQGSSAGCFDCTSSSLQSTAVVGGLTFDASTFDATTDLTGAGLADLGTFTLASTTFNYANNDVDFLLSITFTAPTGLSAGEFTAEVAGSVNALGNGAVNVQFDHTFQTFSFTNEQGSGSFELGISYPNLHLCSNASGSVVGTIRKAQFTAAGVSETAGSGEPVNVPEPASLVLLASGVAAPLRRPSGVGRVS